MVLDEDLRGWLLRVYTVFLLRAGWRCWSCLWGSEMLFCWGEGGEWRSGRCTGLLTLKQKPRCRGWNAPVKAMGANKLKVALLRPY